MSGINWTWRVGEQWALLGPDGSGKSLLVDALVGRASLLKGEVRGPFGEDGAEEVAPEAGIVIVSPQRQRELALGVSSFYQLRWHGGLEEAALTVADFLSCENVEEGVPKVIW